MKNILFLDMDGVLNNSYLTRKWFDKKFQELEDSLFYSSFEDIKIEARHQFNKYTCNNKEYIFPELASLLNEVIKTVDLKLVWSSTWRRLPEYYDIENARKMLTKRGLVGSALIDYTPILDNPYISSLSGKRIEEIEYYIHHNNLNITFNDKLAAIDDLNLSALEKLNIKFFPTEFEYGITEKIKNDMIDYYSK